MASQNVTGGVSEYLCPAPGWICGVPLTGRALPGGDPPRSAGWRGCAPGWRRRAVGASLGVINHRCGV
jgi:hypothetical protein